MMNGFKRKNGVYYLYTNDSLKKIKVYDDFKNNKVKGFRISNKLNSTIYYLGVEKDKFKSVNEHEKQCYKVREIYEIKKKNPRLLEIQKNLEASEVRIYLNNYYDIKKILNTNQFLYKYFTVEFKESYVTINFKKRNSYKNIVKHIYILICFIKFILGRDVVIEKLEYFIDAKPIINVFYSTETIFREIDEAMSMDEKLQLIGKSTQKFFEKWVKFFTTRYIEKILYAFVRVYKSHHFKDIDWNIREIIILMEGIYKSIEYNDKNSELREKISDINKCILEEEKQKSIITNIKKVFSKKEIHEVVTIRHDLCHTNLSRKSKYFYDELLSKSMTTLELYLIYTIKGFKKNKVKNSIEELKNKKQKKLKKYINVGIGYICNI